MAGFGLHALVSFFAVINPIGTVPIFLALSEDRSPEEQRESVWRAVWIAFFILLGFLWLGRWIFSWFGITIAAFQVAGGVIIFGIAMRLLQARSSHVQGLITGEQQEGRIKEDIAVTPLATPILAGPGTIATVMGLSAGGNHWSERILVMLAFSVVLAGSYIIFSFAPMINRKLGQTGMNLVTRMMGLLLAVIAVQMAVAGFTGLFPGLAH